jgi:hypothetical protein
MGKRKGIADPHLHHPQFEILQLNGINELLMAEWNAGAKL